MFSRVVFHIYCLFSFNQAYLAFYVINELGMAQSAKALVCYNLVNVKFLSTFEINFAGKQ